MTRFSIPSVDAGRYEKQGERVLGMFLTGRQISRCGDRIAVQLVARSLVVLKRVA